MVRDDFFDGDRHVLVRDWVEGTSLARMLAERGDPGLPPSAVQRMAQARRRRSSTTSIANRLRSLMAPSVGASRPGQRRPRVLVNAGIGVADRQSWAQPWTAPRSPRGPSDAGVATSTARGNRVHPLDRRSDVADSRRWDGIDPALAGSHSARYVEGSIRSRPPAEIGGRSWSSASSTRTRPICPPAS